MIEDERKRRANLLWDAALEGANKATPSIKSGFMNTIEPLIDELAILSTAIKSLSPLTDMRVRGTENTEKGSGVKCVCSEYQCNWHGMGNEVLTAPNPFEVGGTLYACPECKTVGSVIDGMRRTWMLGWGVMRNADRCRIPSNMRKAPAQQVNSSEKS